MPPPAAALLAFKPRHAASSARTQGTAAAYGRAARQSGGQEHHIPPDTMDPDCCVARRGGRRPQALGESSRSSSAHGDPYGGADRPACSVAPDGGCATRPGRTGTATVPWSSRPRSQTATATADEERRTRSGDGNNDGGARGLCRIWRQGAAAPWLPSPQDDLVPWSTDGAGISALKLTAVCGAGDSGRL